MNKEPLTDSEGTLVTNGDILLSSRGFAPLRYLLMDNQVHILAEGFSGSYSFDYFKSHIQPRFVKA